MIAAATLCVIYAAILVSNVSDERFQREDFRAAAKALGPARVPRAIVITPGVSLEVYVRGSFGMTRPARIREIDLLGLPWFNASGQLRSKPPSG